MKMYILKMPLFTPTKLTLVALLLITMLNGSNGRSFNLQRYCRSQCNIGMGGNLCRCNAFHFAGKRANINRIPGEKSSPRIVTTLDEIPVEDSHPYHLFSNSASPSSGEVSRNKFSVWNTIKARLGPQKYRYLLDKLAEAMRLQREKSV